MKKTFEELLEKEYYFIEGIIDPVITKESCLELMQLVRTQTLKEVADVAEADYNVIGNLDIYTSIEVYVLKESILQLDKNSIQL